MGRPFVPETHLHVLDRVDAVGVEADRINPVRPDLLHPLPHVGRRRAEIIVKHLNLWIPFQRWTRLLGRIERAWCDFLVRLERLVGEEEPLIRRLRERAAVRLQQVCGLYEKYAAERQQIDASFAAGAQWLANGGLSA